MITEGTVAIQSLREHDVYQGKSTGAYTLLLTLADSEAVKITDMGVKVGEYEGTLQRKFSSKFDVMIVGMDDTIYTGPIPKGTKVRVLWKEGNKHPVHGVPTYLNRVRILEVPDTMDEEDAGAF
jgi:hypothetical protein